MVGGFSGPDIRSASKGGGGDAPYREGEKDVEIAFWLQIISHSCC